MKRILLVLIVFWGASTTLPVQASDYLPWPRYSFDIVECKNSSCTEAYYGNVKTTWESFSYNVWSTYETTQLSIVGIHCSYGDKPGNFKRCYFTRDTEGHSPPLVDKNGCRTTRKDNFEIVDRAACVGAPFRGGHSGAAPGAECALLGKYKNDNQKLDTPYGMLDAQIVANARDTYCRKAYPPGETCNISIPNGGLLDHGIQTSNSQSERTLNVSIACGSNPIIKIVNPTLKMDENRIQSDLSITRNGSNYLLRSVLNTTNATDGVHSASTIITVTAN